MVIGLIAGAAADRVSGRLMLMAMQVGQATLAFLLAALAGAGEISVWKMALILAMSQVFVTFEEPSRQVFQRRLVGRSALGHAIALETGLFNAARVLGPAVAGGCLALVGRASPFALNGLSFLAALGILALIRTPPADEETRQKAAEAGLLDGLSYVRGDRRVLRTFLLLGYFGVVGMGYTALVPAYARKVLGSAEGGYSALQIGGGLGSTAGALLVAAMVARRRRDLMIPGGMTLAGASLALAALLPGRVPHGLALPVATACMFANGLGTIAFFATAQAMIQADAPDEVRGRVVGLWMIVFSASSPVGSVLAGVLAGPVGVIPVLVGSAALCLAAGAAVFATGFLAPAAGRAARPDARAA